MAAPPRRAVSRSSGWIGLGPNSNGYRGKSARDTRTTVPSDLEEYVQLPDSLVDLPGPGPAAGEHRGVARPDLGRLAAVGRDRHPAGHDVHDLVGLQGPPGRTRGALPDPGLLIALAG